MPVACCADSKAATAAHGIGEIGITGVGAAGANAIFNTTGTRVRDLPITLGKSLPVSEDTSTDLC
jgi:xanthine dehydrogenase YagR molybdenum-binding subunit